MVTEIAKNVRIFDELIGRTVKSVETRRDRDGDVLSIVVETGNGRDTLQYEFSHSQDCCEDVRIEEVVGNWGDIVGRRLLMAEEVWHRGEVPDGAPKKRDEWYLESYTWTFYKFVSIRGGVTVRWLGESNGYYGEGVSFYRIDEKDAKVELWVGE